MTVYFAMALPSRTIKIGCAKHDVNDRLGTLERETKQWFVLLATCPGGRHVEKWWHQRHRANVVRRRNWQGSQVLTEFFRPVPLLIQDIFDLRQMNGGRVHRKRARP